MLTNKQELFIQNYMITLNATDSYMKVYKCKTDNAAGVLAYRLLRNVKIKEEIDLRLTKRAQDNSITADYVLTSLRNVAERCQQREPVYGKDGEPTGEYKFDSSGANKSLELLGKHLKLFTEKTEISGSIDVGVNIVDDV